jgi:LacI family transcriptional regulator
MSVTLIDIANQAGVSVSTVSRVINKQAKKYRISTKTEKLVLQSAKKLKYRPNQLARGLRLKKTHTIGLLVPDISNPFFAHITRIIQKSAASAGYSLIVCNTDEEIDIELDQIELLRSKGVDGFILMPVGVSHQHIKSLLKASKPIVLLDRSFDELDTNAVVVDNYHGAYQAVEHLINKGHTRIAIIQGLPNTYTNNERVRGFIQALKDKNIPIDESLIVGKDFRKANGYIETKILLNMKTPPTAIFTTSDLITLGSLEAISEEGWKIPDDISIVSFDDIDFAPFLESPLTAVRQPRDLMGEIAVKILMENLRDRTIQEKKRIVLNSKLIIRNSVKQLNIKNHSEKLTDAKAFNS